MLLHLKYVLQELCCPQIPYILETTIILSVRLCACFPSNPHNLSFPCFLSVNQSDAIYCTSLEGLLLVRRCVWLRHRRASQLPSLSFELTVCEREMEMELSNRHRELVNSTSCTMRAMNQNSHKGDSKWRQKHEVSVQFFWNMYQTFGKANTYSAFAK